MHHLHFIKFFIDHIGCNEFDTVGIFFWTHLQILGTCKGVKFFQVMKNQNKEKTIYVFLLSGHLNKYICLSG